MKIGSCSSSVEEAEPEEIMMLAELRVP